MKLLRQLLCLLTLCLSGCLFKEPIFNAGFSKLDPTLSGVWASKPENDDPRKTEFAVLAPLDEERFTLHYPANSPDENYYEARPIKVGERTLLQLRLLASFKSGVPLTTDPRFTILWVKPSADGIQVRALSLRGDNHKETTPNQVKQMLEAGSTDWDQLFGDPIEFRRCADR